MNEIDIEEIKRLYAETKNVRKTAKRYNHSRTKREHTSRSEVTRIVNEKSHKGKGGGSSRAFPSIGIVIFASIFQIFKLFDREFYWDIFRYMPPYVILIRYIFSWVQRCIGMTTAIGLLFLKNVFRKITLVLGIFTICTVYWKHPYQGFLIHTQRLDEQFGHYLAMSGFPELTFTSITRYAVIGNIILDILFWGILIFYFTRSRVKEQFSA